VAVAAVVHLEAVLILLAQAAARVVWFTQLQQVSVDRKLLLLVLVDRLELVIQQRQQMELTQLLQV
jgi:hypothetical protein